MGVVLEGCNAEVERVREDFGWDRAREAESGGVLQLGDGDAERAEPPAEILRVTRQSGSEAREQPAIGRCLREEIELLLGEGGDRIGEHEWALSDEEVEGSALIAELIAAQRENFAGREPVDSDQQRCEAGIERDGAIRREDADDVFELLFGDADRGFSAWECRNIEIGRDVAFGGPGKELREPSSRGAEGDELLDLCLSESAQGRLLFLSPGEEGDEAPQRCFDVPSCADRDE